MEDRFKIKTQTIGQGGETVKEARILNRIIRYTEDGWEYEPDQRHAELIVKELGLQEAKSVATPGDKLKDHERDDGESDSAKATH